MIYYGFAVESTSTSLFCGHYCNNVGATSKTYPPVLLALKLINSTEASFCQAPTSALPQEPPAR